MVKLCGKRHFAKKQLCTKLGRCLSHRQKMPDACPLIDDGIYPPNDEADPPEEVQNEPPAHPQKNNIDAEARDQDPDPTDTWPVSKDKFESESDGDAEEEDSQENHAWRSTSLVTRSGQIVAANRRLQGYLFFSTGTI
ncbi:Hypp6637 [Branchiostoma lanceolatum]|uniref:Hypp6637 protein n=1 Tax=Branchiostoma lanceolatum TaxID=7740 RepID=A0A8J9YVD3_BRALA|nr:Hypp6637 [Branchiostoma lanceolatum]